MLSIQVYHTRRHSMACINKKWSGNAFLESNVRLLRVFSGNRKTTFKCQHSSIAVENKIPFCFHRWVQVHKSWDSSGFYIGEKIQAILLIGQRSNGWSYFQALTRRPNVFCKKMSEMNYFKFEFCCHQITYAYELVGIDRKRIWKAIVRMILNITLWIFFSSPSSRAYSLKKPTDTNSWSPHGIQVHLNCEN